MGARLVSLALSPNWSGLTPRARLVLVIMCQRAHDRDRDGYPAAVYWGGQEELATRSYGEDTPANRRLIRRSLAELIRAGAIEQLTVARGHGVSTYLLTPQTAE